MRPALRYDCGRGRVDRRELRYGRLTLGGVGWISSSSRVATFDRDYSRQCLEYNGHANDGGDGRPRDAKELPF